MRYLHFHPEFSIMWKNGLIRKTRINFKIYDVKDWTKINYNAHIAHISRVKRSSRPDVFCEKDVLRNFAKFTGKHLCQSPFFNKVAALRRATLLKKRLWHRCFPVNFAKFLRTPFFTEHLWWLLLSKDNQKMKLSQLKQCNMRKFFSKNYT